MEGPGADAHQTLRWRNHPSQQKFITSGGQKWEIMCAKEERKKLRGIWAYSDDRTDIDGVPTYTWTDENISSFIDSL